VSSDSLIRFTSSSIERFGNSFILSTSLSIIKFRINLFISSRGTTSHIKGGNEFDPFEITYSEFFHTVKDKIGDKSEVCRFFGIFLFRFMNDISSETTSKILGDFWIFPTENIIKVHFREEPVDEPLELVGGDYFTELL
jgi:hypothetical protein